MSKPSPPGTSPGLAYPWALPLAASAAAWAVLFVAVPPAAQDFPLNDDWAFARSVFQFAHGEGIHYQGWASMPQLGQWLWACPFVWLFGASHVTLRLSTLVLSWLGLAAFYDLLRQEEQTPRQAALATAVLAFNPLFFLLQGTFMTDVPALALALVALALYGRALRGAGIGWLAAACAAAVLAAVTRQNAVAVALAAAVLLGRQPALRRRPLWWLGVALPVAAAGAVHVWFQGRSDVRPLRPAVPSLPTLLLLPFLVIHFCGLSALPLLAGERRPGPWRPVAAAVLLMLAWAACWLFYDKELPYPSELPSPDKARPRAVAGLFPYTENMLTPWGAFSGSRFTGPLVVGEHTGRPLLLGLTLRAVLTLLGCLGGGVLLVRALRQPPDAWTRPLVLFTLLQLPFLLIVTDLYDRYFLFLLPGALDLAGVRPRTAPQGQEVEPSRWVSLVVLGAAGLISVGLMHDWLAWNAARWELGRRALAHGISPLDVEGGVEWDGWHAGLGPEPTATNASRWPVLRFTREWFTTIKGRYVLSFAELRGGRRLDIEPYSLWLTPGRREFFLLEVPPLPAGPQRPRSGP
jgi:hypothetical protein